MIELYDSYVNGAGILLKRIDLLEQLIAKEDDAYERECMTQRRNLLIIERYDMLRTAYKLEGYAHRGDFR